MSDELSDLVALTSAQFQAEQAKLRDILALEKKLREETAELERRHADAQASYHADISGARVYGGDVLWQGWVSRSRRALQIELAQVLMRKGQMIRALQRTYGRKMASENIADEADLSERAKREKRQIEEQQGLNQIDLARKKEF